MLKTRHARSRKSRKGQGLLEYAFLIAGIAFISLLALSVFGHKLSDQYAVAAGMLPGAHDEDNLPVASQKFLGYEDDGSGALASTGEVSWHDIVGTTNNPGAGSLENNVLVAGQDAGGDAFVAD
jgi:hypothetical protein